MKENINKLIAETLDLIEEPNLDIFTSNPNFDDYYLKCENLNNKMNDFFLNNSTTLQSIFSNKNIILLEEQDKVIFYNTFFKIISTVKTENNKYKLTKFLSVVYWNDEKVENGNKTEEIISDVFDMISGFLLGKTTDNIDIKILNPISIENLEKINEGCSINSIKKFINDPIFEKNYKIDHKLFQNLVLPISIEVNDYSDISKISDILKIKDIISNFSLIENNRVSFSEISFILDVLKNNESIKFYNWLEEILNYKIKKEFDIHNINDISSRDGFIHCNISNDGIIEDIDVSVDINFYSGEIKTLNANRKIYDDEEIQELFSFWTSRCTMYDSFTVTFGKKSEEMKTYKNYDTLLFLPKNITTH